MCVCQGVCEGMFGKQSVTDWVDTHNLSNTCYSLLQMENVELFLRACVDYGMQTIDTFQVKELYEARAVYTVSQ